MEAEQSKVKPTMNNQKIPIPDQLDAVRFNELIRINSQEIGLGDIIYIAGQWFVVQGNSELGLTGTVINQPPCVTNVPDNPFVRAAGEGLRRVFGD